MPIPQLNGSKEKKASDEAPELYVISDEAEDVDKDEKKETTIKSENYSDAVRVMWDNSGMVEDWQ